MVAVMNNSLTATRRRRQPYQCTAKSLRTLLTAIVAVCCILFFFNNNNSSSNTFVSFELSPSQVAAKQKHHMVFSTGCNPAHDWQSYVFFYQSLSIKQPGDIIRIASGCSEKQQQELQNFHDEAIAPMSDAFHLHFTPNFGRTGDPESTLFNKPFGVKHWLENVLQYKADLKDNLAKNVHDDDIVILVDPGMAQMKPLVNDFHKEPLQAWLPYLHKTPEAIHTKVDQGKPIAQQYGFGVEWLLLLKVHLHNIVGPDSIVHDFGAETKADRFYSCGPPYILTAKDMYRMSIYWSRYIPDVYDIVDHGMAQMYSYSLASAHIELKHQAAKGFMVSQPFIEEGWFPFHEDSQLQQPETACGVLSKTSVTSSQHRPYILHYCQNYVLGEWMFSPYSFPTDFFTDCSSPLILEPPVDLIRKYDLANFTDESVVTLHMNREKTSRYVHRQAFMLCSVIPILNRAATYFKTKHCDAEIVNLNKEWHQLPK